MSGKVDLVENLEEHPKDGFECEPFYSYLFDYDYLLLLS